MYSKDAVINQSKPKLGLTIFSVLFVGLNLRPAITAVPIVVPLIKNTYYINSTLLGLLTSIPLLVFVLLSLQAPKFGFKVGLPKAILYSLCLLEIGFLLRLVPSIIFLYLSMLVIGIAITIGNILLPAYIKQYYSDKAGILTGIYTLSLYVGPALTAAFTLQIANATDSWRLALFFWNILLLIAIPLWLPHLRNSNFVANSNNKKPKISFKFLLHNPLAWSVGIYFAVLSGTYYTISAWLPTLLKDKGIRETTGSNLLALINLIAVPFALIISILVFKTKRQVWATSTASILMLVGLLGIYSASNGKVLFFIVIFGIGSGICTGIAFSLAMLRSSTPAMTAALGGFSQTIGYLLAALGPVGAGIIYDLTNSWNILILILAIMLFLQLICGLKAGKDETILAPN